MITFQSAANVPAQTTAPVNGRKQRPRMTGYDVSTWLKRLPSDAHLVVHRRTLFGDDQTGIIDAGRDTREIGPPMNVWGWPLKVSSSERAILEALDELSSEASFENLDKIFESLTTLRPKLLMRLLTVCRSVRVRRLFFVFADRHQHAWRKYLDVNKIDFGSGPRALVESGKLHPTYRIYVPKRFMPAKDTEADADA
ncbi:type IV toxin-antitoxin system AbiEi family antitoxin domain-containing protein [Aquisalimonas sp. 2447]|uniref:type IV toxin-antitoxin system AbiEi family antitoxin domain-containing protein n=1 Tax=Aquisalimonas sp. 2447 TaxID=2740807 RepID=UPI001C2C148C|nr:type IV toxin-antitoxin system AbiEi family antitoxin domain-containing protein [Aquisalimonas sp. 2447]